MYYNDKKDLSEKEASELEQRMFDDSHSEMEKYFEVWKELEQLYWGDLQNKDNPWKSKVFDPESYEKVERMVSRVFATYPKGRFAGREKTDNARAAIVDAIVKYQWERPGQNMFLKLRRGGIGMGVFGGSFQILTWRYEVDQDGNPVWDDPFYRDLYNYDCFPDMNASDVDSMCHFQFNDYATLEELEAGNNELEERYINLAKLKKAVKGKSKEGDSSTASTDSYRTNVNTIRGGSSTEVAGRILVRRTFTKSKWIAKAVDYDILIENRDNPNKHGQLPVHLMTDGEYPNQLFGRGEIEPIKGLQKGLNTVVNQRLDNVRLIMNQMMKVKATNKYASTYRFAPGGVFLVDNMDDVEPLEIPDVTGNTFIQTTNYFKDGMAKALGHFDALSRNETSSDRTATEAKFTAGEQNARMRQKEMMLDAYVKRLMTQWVQLNQQYLTEARSLRIVGKDAMEALFASSQAKDPQTGMTGVAEVPYQGKLVKKFDAPDNSYGFLVVEPGDIEGQFDFINESGSMSSTNSDEEFQNLKSAFDLLVQAQPLLAQSGTSVDFTPITEKILNKVNFKDTESTLKLAPTQNGDPSAGILAGAGGQVQGNNLQAGQPSGAPGLPGIPGVA